MIAFLDTETGGFSISKNGVCEIALVAVNEKFEVVHEFHCYIKPYTRADDTDELVSYKDDAMEINGLSVEFLIENGIDVTEAMNLAHLFLKKHGITKIIGHNVKIFDIPRVEHLLMRFLKESIMYLDSECTLKMSREKWPSRASHKLEHLCEWLDIPNPDKHTAKGDCYSNIELYKKLIA